MPVRSGTPLTLTFHATCLCQIIMWEAIQGITLSCSTFGQSVGHFIKSYTIRRIFFKLGSTVCLNMALCSPHDAVVPAKGQGHTWRSNVRGYEGHWLELKVVLVCYCYGLVVSVFFTVMSWIFSWQCYWWDMFCFTCVVYLLSHDLVLFLM